MSRPRSFASGSKAWRNVTWLCAAVVLVLVGLAALLHGPAPGNASSHAVEDPAASRGASERGDAASIAGGDASRRSLAGATELRLLTGKAVGPCGEPVYARLTTAGSRTLCNRTTGVFECQVSIEAQHVHFDAPGYRDLTVPVPLTGEDVGIVKLVANGSSEVLVARRGVPVEGAVVVCWRQADVEGFARNAAIQLPECFEARTDSAGSALLPGGFGVLAFACEGSDASRCAFLPAESVSALELEPSFCARIVEPPADPAGFLVVQLCDVDLVVARSQPADGSGAPLPIGSMAIAWRVAHGEYELQPSGEESTSPRSGRTVRDYVALPKSRRVHVREADSGEPVEQVVFSPADQSNSPRQKDRSYARDGFHRVPAIPPAGMWIGSPGYESAFLRSIPDTVTLSRSPSSTFVRVLGEAGYRDALVIRSGFETLFVGTVENGAIGPMDASILPAQIRTPDGRVVGETRRDADGWIVDATALGTIRIANLHELHGADGDLAIGVWRDGGPFVAADASSGDVPFLIPGVHSIGYGRRLGGFEHRLPIERVDVVAGLIVECTVRDGPKIEGSLVVQPPECANDLVYFPVWREPGGATELRGMTTPASVSRFRWPLPQAEPIAIAIAGRNQKGVFRGMLARPGGELRMRRVRVATDLQQGVLVVVGWELQAASFSAFETSVGSGGLVDLGWLPTEVTEVRVMHDQTTRSIRIAADGTGTAPFAAPDGK